MLEKRCTRCGETKPVSEFYRRSDSQRGKGAARWQSRCKPCHNIAVEEGRGRRQERPNPAERTEKACSVCGEVKALDEFYRDRREPDGRAWWCKVCTSAKRSTPEARAAERERYQRNREKSLKQQREYKRRRYAEGYRGAVDSERRAARLKLQAAVRDGRITRPDTCEDCGVVAPPSADGLVNIHAHHDDYSKPFDVRWLCAACHGKQHRIDEEARV